MLLRARLDRFIVQQLQFNRHVRLDTGANAGADAIAHAAASDAETNSGANSSANTKANTESDCKADSFSDPSAVAVSDAVSDAVANTGANCGASDAVTNTGANTGVSNTVSHTIADAFIANAVPDAIADPKANESDVQPDTEPKFFIVQSFVDTESYSFQHNAETHTFSDSVSDSELQWRCIDDYREHDNCVRCMDKQRQCGVERRHCAAVALHVGECCHRLRTDMRIARVGCKVRVH